MKVLYLTDNKSEYTSGTYYQDWLDTFRERFVDITVFGPGYSTNVDEIPEDIDLVVYGHSFFDTYLQTNRSPIYNGFDIRKLKDKNSILFCKNEYKYMEERIEFVRGIDNCVLVAHVRETFRKYFKDYPKLIWIPFGIKSDRFRDLGLVRHTDIGMRGNKHTQYIGDLRTKMADTLIDRFGYLNLDVKLSDNGEDFIQGDAYVTWLNHNKFTANTVSALNGVNTKFVESIGAGSLLLCPPGEYEGLLIKDKHYVDYNDILYIKSKEEFDAMYEEKLNTMSKYLDEFKEEFSYSNLLAQIIDALSKY